MKKEGCDVVLLINSVTLQIWDLYKDELFMECGDAVEWSDFRLGTRGAMKLRWPSLILGISSSSWRQQYTFSSFVGKN